MLTKLRDAIWPTLEEWQPSELSEIRAGNHEEIEAIQSTDWSDHPEIALAEALRISSDEEDRKKTAESKASNLLMVSAALIPIFTGLDNAMGSDVSGNTIKWLNLSLLALTILYLCWSALWSLRTMAPSNYSRVYQSDLVKIWKDGTNIHRDLLIETLKCSRLNQDTINKKVSCAKMGHAFLFRAIIAFTLLLTFRTATEIYCTIFYKLGYL